MRRALYLLFNEGYHGASAESAVRAELCGEAMRLTALLARAPAAGVTRDRALAALMCLHAARLPARLDAAGDLKSLFDQDRSRWDSQLVARRASTLLEQSASGTDVSAVSRRGGDCRRARRRAGARADTDWSTIVALYDRLMSIAPSPVVALEPRDRHRRA